MAVDAALLASSGSATTSVASTTAVITYAPSGVSTGRLTGARKSFVSPGARLIDWLASVVIAMLSGLAGSPSGDAMMSIRMLLWTWTFPSLRTVTGSEPAASSPATTWGGSGIAPTSAVRSTKGAATAICFTDRATLLSASSSSRSVASRAATIR